MHARTEPGPPPLPAAAWAPRTKFRIKLLLVVMLPLLLGAIVLLILIVGARWPLHPRPSLAAQEPATSAQLDCSLIRRHFAELQGCEPEDLWDGLDPPASTDRTWDISEQWFAPVTGMFAGQKQRWKWGATVVNKWKDTRRIMLWVLVAHNNRLIAYDWYIDDVTFYETREFQGGVWVPPVQPEGDIKVYFRARALPE